jgi:AraC-like DNA-binding protein
MAIGRTWISAENVGNMGESYDVLGDILESAFLKGWLFGQFQAAAPWGLRGSELSAAFYVMLQGHACLKLDSAIPGVSVGPGDFAVVLPGSAHSLCDRCDSPTLSLACFLQSDATCPRPPGPGNGDGATVRVVCGVASTGKHPRGALLGALPPLLVVRGVEGKPAPWLADTLRLLFAESDRTPPGAQAVVDHLAHVVLIQSVRNWIRSEPAGQSGWLAALRDPEIGPALELMHSQLGYPWTVAALADRVCLSRSTFAARFKDVVAKPPLQYLLERRMEKACVLIAEGRCEIKEIASQIGYATRSAFSNAFRRWSGMSPGKYRLFRRHAVAERSRAAMPCRRD